MQLVFTKLHTNEIQYFFEYLKNKFTLIINKQQLKIYLYLSYIRKQKQKNINLKLCNNLLLQMSQKAQGTYWLIKDNFILSNLVN